MSNRPDISLFVPTLRGGGAERMMVRLGNAFVEQGYATDLVLVRRQGQYFGELDDRVEVVNLAAPRILASLPKLVSYLRRRRPKSLLSTLTYANVVAIWARKLAGHPERLVVREALSISAVRAHATSLKDFLIPFFIRHVYGGADFVVGISYGVSRDLMRRGLPDAKVHTIYNPAVFDELCEEAAKPVDHDWFRRSGPGVILGVGRFVQQKDFPTLIRAFGAVQSRIDARLVILGEGELRPELESLISELGLQDEVSLPGFVSNPFSHMARSDVFVLSSRWEGFGNVLVEAMAVGTPVISTDCPSGPAEILEDGRYGRLVDVGDVEQMAEAILETLARPVSAATLKARASEFSVDRISQHYRSLLVGE